MTGTFSFEAFAAAIDRVSDALPPDHLKGVMIISPEAYRGMALVLGMVTGRHHRARGARARKRARMASIRCWRFSA